MSKKRAGKFDRSATEALTMAVSHPGEGAKVIAAIKSELSSGADPDGDSIGLAPLAAAAKSGQRAAARLLIKAGADLERGGEMGRTPLILAALEPVRGAQIARDLIKAGARIDAVDESGWTALMHASVVGNRELVEILIQAGANLDHGTATGWGPLVAAIYREREVGAEMIDLLFERGARATLVILEKARGWKKEEVANRLERAQRARDEAEQIAGAALAGSVAGRRARPGL